MGHYHQCQSLKKILPKPGEEDFYSPICCFHDNFDGGETKRTPGFPTKHDVPDTDGDGILDDEDIDEFFRRAWPAIKRQMKKSCDNEACKGLTKAEFPCSPDLEIEMEKRARERGYEGFLPCGKLVVFDCKSGKFKAPLDLPPDERYLPW